MKQTDRTRAQPFEANLRGERVMCSVEDAGPGPARITVRCYASEPRAGLRSVSKFAGYCDRILVLVEPHSADLAWAQLLASYYGFGLEFEVEQTRNMVMAAPVSDIDYSTGARARFLRAVLAQRL